MENAKNKNGFIKGILVLSVGGFIAKIIGALYRIPLTNIVGAYGMGIYQLVFPLYALLLTISTAGIPVAISKLVAEQIAHGNEKGAKKIFVFALLLLGAFGLVGSGVLFVFSDGIATLQGNAAAGLAYKLISPSVFLVCIISAFRGYFQGQISMTPTALSQIIEQTVKLSLGLVLALHFLPDIVMSVMGAIAAVTVSEAAALVVLVLIYLFSKRNRKKPAQIQTAQASSLNSEDLGFKPIAKKLLLLCIPITLSGIILPLMQLIDSVLVLNLLKSYNATELYGIWAGPVHSLLNLPVALTVGIAASIVPAVSAEGAAGQAESAKRKILFGLKLTVVFALPAAIGLSLLAKPVVTLLYSGLSQVDLELAAELVRISAITVLFISVTQTFTAALQAAGQLYAPVIALIIAAVVKTVLNAVLLSVPSVGIYGAAIASVACFFVACSVDMLYIVRRQKLKIPFFELLIKPLACSLVMALVIVVFRNLVFAYISSGLGALLLICIGAAAYLIMLPVMQVFDKEESVKVLAMLHIRKKAKTASEK